MDLRGIKELIDAGEIKTIDLKSDWEAWKALTEEERSLEIEKWIKRESEIGGKHFQTNVLGLAAVRLKK